MESGQVSHQICGVILAGGLGSRMQYKDKPLLQLGNKSLIEHVIHRARPQVNQLAISVNRNLDDYKKFQLSLIPDIRMNSAGPLVGIYSALKWYAEQNYDAQYLACFPADVPFFPTDIVTSLKEVLEMTTTENSQKSSTPARVAWCQTGEQIQPLFSLWPFAVLETLEQSIQSGAYGPKMFFEQQPGRVLHLPEPEDLMFLNINNQDELSRAETLLGVQ